MNNTGIAEHLGGTGIITSELMMAQLRILLSHEPYLHGRVHQPTPESPWTIQVPAVLRGYHDVATIEDYIDCRLPARFPEATSRS